MDPDPAGLLLWETGIIILAVALSAIVSSVETALLSLSGARAQRLIDDGAKWLRLWLDRSGMVITAVLILKSFFMVTAVAFTVDATSKLLSPAEFASWGLWVSVLGMTFITLTLTQIVPKAIGKRWFEALASWGIRFLRVPYFMFYPVNWAYARLSQMIVRSIGGDRLGSGPVTFDEIEYIINQRSGGAEDDRERLLRSVVEFPDTLVREVMVPRTDVVALDESMNVDELISCLVQCGHSRLPVIRDDVDDIVGVFYAKDLLKYFNDQGSLEGFVPGAHFRTPFFVPEGKRIAELLSEFQRQHMHMAIVVDEFGGTSGLITLEDIVEEIFGEIQDEYDKESEVIQDLGDGRLLADARAPIDDIEDFYGLVLADHADYESLGGFLLAQAGEVPDIGDTFDVGGLRFRVADADTKKVISVEIEQEVIEATAQS